MKELIKYFLWLQLVNATNTPEDVVSIWSYTNYREEYLEVFVWSVVILPQEGIVIIAGKAITEIRRKISPTERLVNVSTWYMMWWNCSVKLECAETPVSQLKNIPWSLNERKGETMILAFVWIRIRNIYFN